MDNKFRWIIGAGILFMVIYVFFNQLNPRYFGLGSDESYYFLYAKTIHNNGYQAFEGLLKWYTESFEAQKHPSPIRFGYIYLLSMSFTLFGISCSTIALISIISFVLLLAVSFHYIRKYFSLDMALLSVLFLSYSPLLIGLSRRALADSLVNLLWCCSIWLFLDVLTRRSKNAYLALIVVLTAAISVKEASIILLGFFVLAAYLAKPYGYSIPFKTLVGIIFWPLTCIIASFMLIFGGIDGLWGICGSIFSTHIKNPQENYYAIAFSSGPWFRYVVDFILLSPITTLLFLGFLGAFLKSKEKGFVESYLVVFFVYVYGVLSLLPHTKVVRFVASLEMVIAICAAVYLYQLLKPRLLLYAVTVIVVYNWVSVQNFFFTHSLLDPISYHLFTLRHFAPI